MSEARKEETRDLNDLLRNSEFKKILSNTEWKVARLLCDGLMNKEIAHRLMMAEATVKVHVKSIIRSLQLKNRVQVAVWMVRNGFDWEGDRAVGE